MWSLGCILAELYTGFALLPGEDESDQLACIIELLGMPPQKLLTQSKRTVNFFTSSGHPRYCQLQAHPNGTLHWRSGLSPRGKERKPPGKKDLKLALKNCDDPLFINFLQGCLEWDPELRMTPATALKHSWFRRRRLPMLPPSSSTSTTSATTVTSSSSSAVSSSHGSATAATAAQATTGGGAGAHHHHHHHHPQQQHQQHATTTTSATSTSMHSGATSMPINIESSVQLLRQHPLSKSLQVSTGQSLVGQQPSPYSLSTHVTPSRSVHKQTGTGSNATNGTAIAASTAAGAAAMHVSAYAIGSATAAVAALTASASNGSKSLTLDASSSAATKQASMGQATSARDLMHAYHHRGGEMVMSGSSSLSEANLNGNGISAGMHRGGGGGTGLPLVVHGAHGGGSSSTVSGHVHDMVGSNHIHNSSSSVNGKLPHIQSRLQQSSAAAAAAAMQHHQQQQQLLQQAQAHQTHNTGNSAAT